MGYFRVFSPLPPTTFSSFFSGRGPGSSGRSGLGKTNILNCCPPRPAPAPAPSRCAWLWWLRKGPSAALYRQEQAGASSSLSPSPQSESFPRPLLNSLSPPCLLDPSSEAGQSLEFSNFKINVLQFTQYSKRGHTSVFPFIKLPTSESHFKNQFQTLL